MAKRDYYDILGIRKDASDDEIKKAYRGLVKKYHPDSNPGDETAETKMKEVNEAYAVLKDADKRAKYDQFGHAASDAGFGQGFEGFSGFGGFGGFADFADIINDLGGFGGGRRRRGPAPGESVEATMRISFEESIFGVERELELNIKDTCDSCKGSGAKAGTAAENCRACNGTGKVRQAVQTPLGYMETTSPCRSCRGAGRVIKEPCTSCGGAGKTAKKKKIVVNVPKGIDNGQSIKYTGQGEAGEIGAPKGDLYVRILVGTHNTFARRGSNLYMDKEISFAQAALGGEIVIDTPYGQESYKLAAGTQPESIITLRGKGVPHVNSPGRVGDLVVTFKVVVPRSLTDVQKDLLKRFAAEDGEEIEEVKKGFFAKRKK